MIRVLIIKLIVLLFFIFFKWMFDSFLVLLDNLLIRYGVSKLIVEDFKCDMLCLCVWNFG